MPNLENVQTDRGLERDANEAYFQRQQGRIASWTAKIDQLSAIKLEGLKSEEVAQIKADLATCTREIKKIETELELAEKLGKPGAARQTLKHPATPPAKVTLRR